MSSRNALRQDFEQVITAIREKKIDPTAFITHTVNFEEAAGSFAGWLQPGSGVIKPMIQL